MNQMLLDWTGTPIGDVPRRKLLSPADVFGGTMRHACLNGCGNVMVVPDRNTIGAPEVLCEGDVWACNGCGALHEYGMYYREGGRYGQIRLLAGSGKRESGEIGVRELLAKDCG
jgi:hypothetical protein